MIKQTSTKQNNNKQEKKIKNDTKTKNKPLKKLNLLN
jgi:hypothetical protein